MSVSIVKRIICSLLSSDLRALVLDSGFKFNRQNAEVEYVLLLQLV
jgi:hypothetical protein